MAYRRLGASADDAGLSADYVAIIAALRQIPADQRRAIVLHHLVGLPVEQIGRETGVPPGTVKARLARWRRALAPLLAETEPDHRNHGNHGQEVARDV